MLNVCYGAAAGKVKAISPYHGTPAPPNGMPCLQFEANTTIALLSDEDHTWWQVSNTISVLLDYCFLELITLIRNITVSN